MWIASPKPRSDPLTVLCACWFTCSLVGANTGGCQVNAAVFTEGHWFTRSVQFTEKTPTSGRISWKLRGRGSSKQWSQWVGRCGVTWWQSDTPVWSRGGLAVAPEAGGAEGARRGTAQVRYMCASAEAMNREDHYYPSQVFKDSCAYQRSHGEDYSHSPPPCLYMSRQVHSVYTPPSMGALEQASLTDIGPPYGLQVREDPPQLHHPQGLQQQPLQPAAGYGDTGEQSRYHLPFPWMKTTKSHSHTWKGQWAGNSSKPSKRESLNGELRFLSWLNLAQNTSTVLVFRPQTKWVSADSGPWWHHAPNNMIWVFQFTLSVNL